MRKGHGAQERLQVKPIGHFDHVMQFIGQAIGLYPFRRDQNGKAVCLMFPEILILLKNCQMFLQRPDASLGQAGLLQLCDGLAYQITEIGPALPDILRHRSRFEVDRHAGIRPRPVKRADLVQCRGFNIKHWYLLDRLPHRDVPGILDFAPCRWICIASRKNGQHAA